MATRSLGQLTIDIIAKIAGFEQGLDRAARTADKRMKQIEASAKSAGLAIGAIGGAVVTGIGVIIRNTMQAEKSLAQLDAILKSTGNAAGYTREQLVSMAAEFQKRSTFDTNEIIEAQTRLLSYSGVLGENIPRAMQAIIDQSTRLEMSLSQSAEVIGRALESPAKAAAALAQQGFGAAFTKEVRASIEALVAAGREGEAQIKILEILEESYGGAAEAARNTFGGALAALKNTLGDLLSGDDESLNGLTASINELIETLNDPDVRKGFQLIVNGATEGATAVARLTNEFAKAVSRYRDWLADAGRLPADMLDSIDQLEARIRKLAQMQYGGGLLNDLRRAIFGDAIEEELRRAVARRNMLANGLPDSSNATLSPIRRGGGGGGKSGKSEAEKEAERLQRAYDSMMESMRKRIALFGQEGEAARVRYEIEQGSLKALDDAKKQALLAEAQRIDQMERMAESARARFEFDEWAAQLAGPVAGANFQFAVDMERLNELARKGEISAERLAEAQAKLRAEHEKNVEAIKQQLDPFGRLLKDYEFENELMRMGNVDRELAIALRHLNAKATDEEVRALRDQIKANRDLAESIQFMDDMRGEFRNFFEDIISGTESVSDAFKNLINGIADMITRFVSQRLVEQLFGGFGTSQGGSTGWISAIAGLFGGRRASGGWTSPNTMYEVNERGIEMATVRGRDYLLTGNSPVEITPHHRLGFGGASVTNNFAFAAPTSPKTQSQIAARVGYEIRRAQRLGV